MAQTPWRPGSTSRRGIWWRSSARPAAGSPLDALAAARELSSVTDMALRAAVDQARAAGQSWSKIGDVLGTTRQAAFQRFGRPADPGT